MTQNMAVLYIKHTGHVLAAFTRTADPDGTPDLAAVVGAGFMLRNPLTHTFHDRLQFVLPPDVLDVKVVPVDPAVFVNPQTFVVDGDQVTRVGGATTARVSALTQTAIDIALPANTTSDLKVWAAIAGRAPATSERQIVAGQINSGSANVTLTLAILPGDYGVAVAAAGLPIAFGSRSVP
ncbi:MAG: hypothetical protein U1E38_06145 [Rhodospirillales bacterium]